MTLSSFILGANEGTGKLESLAITRLIEDNNHKQLHKDLKLNLHRRRKKQRGRRTALPAPTEHRMDESGENELL